MSKWCGDPIQDPMIQTEAPYLVIIIIFLCCTFPLPTIAVDRRRGQRRVSSATTTQYYLVVLQM